MSSGHRHQRQSLEVADLGAGAQDLSLAGNEVDLGSGLDEGSGQVGAGIELARAAWRRSPGRRSAARRARAARSVSRLSSVATSISRATDRPHSGCRWIREMICAASLTRPMTKTRWRYQPRLRATRRSRLRDKQDHRDRKRPDEQRGQQLNRLGVASERARTRNQLHIVETRKTVANSSETVMLSPRPTECGW